jgi:hypothetical protein
MNYVVKWDDSASDELLVIATSSGDAGGTVAAITEINQRLAADPKADATVHEGLWIVTVRRLRVMYEIDDFNRRVMVVGLRLLLT